MTSYINSLYFTWRHIVYTYAVLCCYKKPLVSEVQLSVYIQLYFLVYVHLLRCTRVYVFIVDLTRFNCTLECETTITRMTLLPIIARYINNINIRNPIKHLSNSHQFKLSLLFFCHPDYLKPPHVPTHHLFSQIVCPSKHNCAPPPNLSSTHRLSSGHRSLSCTQIKLFCSKLRRRTSRTSSIIILLVLKKLNPQSMGIKLAGVLPHLVNEACYILSKILIFVHSPLIQYIW